MTNGISCELEMQDKMSEWISMKNMPYAKEVQVREVGRIADFLLLYDDVSLVNIEAKCNNFYCLINQLNDHAKYCDYSFAFIPDYSLTPKWFKSVLSEKGYGLIIYNYNSKSITEVLEAHFNKPTDHKHVRRRVIDLIRKPMIQKTLFANANP